MSQTAEELLVKRFKSHSKETSTKDMLCVKIELMDLPEHILMRIFNYLDHDFLRHIASRVNMEFERVSRTQVLWTQATLSFYNFFQGYPRKLYLGEKFIRDILVTPYLHHLIVWMLHLKGALRSAIEGALVSTRCRLHKLTLSVDDYNPEIVQFLKQHPELRELELFDNATDNEYAVSVSAIVGHLVPHLISLNLSHSFLPNMPKTALLLASASVPHGEDHNSNLVESSLSLSEGSGTQDPQGALDLRNVDGENCEVAKLLQIQPQPQGLLHLKFSPFDVPLHIEPSSVYATAAKNLSALLHTYKDTLKTAGVSLPSQDVWMALGECLQLEELSANCDSDGSGFCAMLQTMQQSSLRRLDLFVPATLGAQGLATVLQTLSQHAPRLEALSLFSPDGEDLEPSINVFPGFGPLRPLLLGREGPAGPAGPATLREVRIRGLGPVGCAQLRELASMAVSNKLSLRKLRLEHCDCSEGLSWAECRCRSEDFLRTAMPYLEYISVYDGDDYDYRHYGGSARNPCECEHGAVE